MSDPLMDRLASLPDAPPDAVRSARTRALCRARVSVRAAAAPASESHAAHGLWRPAIAVLGVLYMIEAMVMALRIYG